MAITEFEGIQDRQTALAIDSAQTIFNNTIKQLQAENAVLKENLASAQKDAERYRWLRADSRPAAWGLEYWVGYWECSTFGDDLDAAIDKEIAK